MHTRSIALMSFLLVFAVLFASLAGGKKGKGKDSKALAEKPLAALNKDLDDELFAILEPGTRSADMQTRALAVRTLARIRPLMVGDYVVDALSDPQWIVRHAAVQALIRAGNVGYRKTLAAAVVNTELYADKELSPLPLVMQLPDEEAIDLLREALGLATSVQDLILEEIFKKDSPIAKAYFEGLRSVPVVKTWVLNNLDIIRDKLMYPLLVKTVPELEKADLLKVFGFLAELDSSYDVSFLQSYMGSDDEEILEGAAFVLALRGDAKAGRFMLGFCDLNEVKLQLRCLQAIRGLATDDEVKETAKRFLYGHPDPDLLYAAYDIFATAKDESVYDNMVVRLQSTEIGHRAAAVYFIAKMKGTRALTELYGLLRDGSPLIRISAARAIGELRQAESVPNLADALRHDKNAEVKKALVEALGQIADRSIIPVVSFLIFDPDVKGEAIKALAGVNHKDSVQTLRNVLTTQFSKEERAVALRAIIRNDAIVGLNVYKGCLGWIPEGFVEELADELGPAAIDFLKVGLTSINDRVRHESVLAFRFLEPAQELEVLQQELFSAKDVVLRVAILRRLGDVMNEESLKVAEAFYKDPTRELRLASIEIASRYLKPDSESLTKLRANLLDSEETYRVAAAAAFVQIYLGSA